jgi:hypothetical protein
VSLINLGSGVRVDVRLGEVREDQGSGEGANGAGTTAMSCLLMAFVLDASVTACWALANEDHPIADAALSSIQTKAAVAPILWRFEVGNILIVNLL